MGLIGNYMGAALGKGIADFGSTMMNISFEDYKLKKREELETRMAELKNSFEVSKEDRAQQYKAGDEKRKVDASDAERKKMNDAISAGATGLIAQKFSGNQIADPSTWTPEQESVRSQVMQEQAGNTRTRAQAAANVGYIDEAAKLDKIAESGASTIPWGSIRTDSEGNIIADNASELRGRIAQQGADTKTEKASGAGKPYKMDEDDKINLTNAHTAVAKAEDSLTSALEKLMPGDKTSPAVEQAQKRVSSAKLNLFSKQVQFGQITADELKDKILAKSGSGPEIYKELGLLIGVIGQEKTDEVASLIMSDDRYKALSKPATQPAQAAQPAKPATGMMAEAVPDEYKARVAEKEAKTRAEKDAELDVVTAQAKATQSLRSEAESKGLMNPKVIAVMRPNEAQAMLRKYRSVLPIESVKLLNKQL